MSEVLLPWKIRLKTKLYNHNQIDASAKWTGNNTSQFACLSISRSPAGTIIRFSSFGRWKEKKTFSSLSCTNSTERSRELRWKLHIWHSKWGYFFWRSIPVCLFVCKRSDKILYHGMQQSSIRKKHRLKCAGSAADNKPKCSKFQLRPKFDQTISDLFIWFKVVMGHPWSVVRSILILMHL